MIERLKRPDLLFLVTVVLPTALAVAYFGLLASDVYISEARFVVRSPDKPSASPLGALLSATGFSGSNEETFAVIEYLRSRDAMSDTNRDRLLNRAYGPGSASWFDRFGGALGGTSAEHLFMYYTGKVTVDFDTSTQVSTLSVRAFRPKDAREIDRRLLVQAEALVNRLNERGRSDTVRNATGEVELAQQRARDAAVALSRFRDGHNLLDPEKQGLVALQMISKLQDELIATRTQLQQIEAFTPRNPQLPPLRKRVDALKREIDQQTALVAGGKGSLSAVAAQYQQLQLESQFADKQLTSALATLEQAKNEALRKQAYVERISEPSLPDYPVEPRRSRGIVATFALSLLAWGILKTLIAGIREHRD